MSSILPGYNYDVFISYRQNDNQDGWVTQFVESLQRETKSIFKEEISIYFDSNPHDGLHETHDVDGSLKEKIKCLVFIPIVSQTYCDPKSFAWQKEFLTFIEFAKQDEFGLDIKLGGGNVAKRVLPVCIHEISGTDKKVFENEIDGVMRSVDFNHKGAGVNRPLTVLDDQVRESGQILYRDQANKVANAIKSVIIALASIQSGEPLSDQPSSEKSKQFSFSRDDNKLSKTNWLSLFQKTRTIGYALSFIAFGFMAAYFLLKTNSSPDKEKTAQKLNLEIDLPIKLSANSFGINISEDGKRIVYSGANAFLYSRNLNSYESTLIPGTENGEEPFLSPDGSNLAFRINTTLYVTHLDNYNDTEPKVITNG